MRTDEELSKQITIEEVHANVYSTLLCKLIHEKTIQQAVIHNEDGAIYNRYHQYLGDIMIYNKWYTIS